MLDLPLNVFRECKPQAVKPQTAHLGLPIHSLSEIMLISSKSVVEAKHNQESALHSHIVVARLQMTSPFSIFSLTEQFLIMVCLSITPANHTDHQAGDRIQLGTITQTIALIILAQHLAFYFFQILGYKGSFWGAKWTPLFQFSDPLLFLKPLIISKK